MYRVSTARFRKLRTCPSAEVLILYKDAVLTREREERVARHLDACDFCGAEMQLLSKHWSHDCPVVRGTDELPTNLRRLAEDLMAEPSIDRARFLETICELDRMTLTDAA